MDNSCFDAVEKALYVIDQSGMYAIARLEDTTTLTIEIVNGKTNRISSSNRNGIGIHAFGRSGGSGFASTYKLGNAEDTATLASSIAKASSKYCEAGEKWYDDIRPLKINLPMRQRYPFEDKSIAEKIEMVRECNMLSLQDVSCMTRYDETVSKWIIGRSDGTLVYFEIPGTILRAKMTAKDGISTASTRISVGSNDLSVLIGDKRDFFDNDVKFYSQLAKDLLKAKPSPSGHHKLAIDYGLGGTLAHEAFGHMVESDLMLKGDSALGKRFEQQKVANPYISIVDYSDASTRAYQPVSANGVLRKRATIVKEGVLVGCLSDVFTYKSVESYLTGAGRAETFANVSIPRMSSTELIVDDSHIINKPAGTPLDDAKLIYDEGLVDDRLMVMIGDAGGQVDTGKGNFVFGCQAVYEISRDGDIVLRRPAQFSGNTLDVLNNIELAIGREKLSAEGTCGKSNQDAPVCCISHPYLLVRRSDKIVLGGSDA